jgi:hypothetical protein
MLQPTAFQSRVLAVPEQWNLALLGGRGGGKTTGLSLLVLRHCAAYGPAAKPLVIRQSYQGLQRIEEELLQLFTSAFGQAVAHNRAEHIFRLPNGATVELGQITDQKSYIRYQGRETTLLCLDELTNYSTTRFTDLLRSNLRSPAGVPLRVVVTGNPGGPLHAVVAKRHVHGRLPWRPYQLDEDGDVWVTCPSVFTDNPHLDHASYQRQIMASAGGDLALARSWLDGDWSELSGAFFSDVWGSHCILPDEPWTVPRRDAGWRSYVALDWGMSAPSVALLCARPMLHRLPGPGSRSFPAGSLIVLDEVTTADPRDPTRGLGWPPQMLAEEVIAACRRWRVSPRGVGDDARGLEGSTLLEQLRRWGLALERPVKDRISGWVAVKQMMSAAKSEDPDTPGLWVSERCRYTLETLPIVARSELRREDLATDGPDHAADALRYGVAHNPRGVTAGRVHGYF